MKMKDAIRMMKKSMIAKNARETVLVILLLLMLDCSVRGQTGIGIDVANPDPSAILDLDDTDDARGLLVPCMNTTERNAITSPADGLLVYDSQQKMFYHYDASVTAWQAVNPFSYWRGAGTAEDNFIMAFTDFPAKKSFVIGDVATPTARLEVDGDIEGSGNLNITQNVSAATITSSGNITVGAGGTIQGKGTVPLGGIVIWSGRANTVPSGWALCDGQTTAEGFKTPDLSGRFIVGFDDAGAPNDYTQPGDLSVKGTIEGNRGGDASITLDLTQMPTHTHPATASTDGGHTHAVGTRGYLTDIDGLGKDRADGADGSGDDSGVTSQSAGSHSHTIAVQNRGGGLPHENRPPYYVLAFIMRVR